MIRSYDCPSCGATLSFESSIAISAVCPFCRSLVIRRDLNVETLGTLAQLPPDLSPLQIGTTGEFQGLGFRLAGRLRWHWEGGSWTEWFADCGTGGHVWIAETQGFYTFSREIEQASLPSIDTVQAGYEEKIGETLWTVVDIKTAICVGGEGELPEVVAQNKSRRSVDLQGPHGEFATLEAGAGGTEYYEGRYARFSEMNFGNLRAVPGWTPGADGQRIEGQSTSFSCPNCAAPVNVRVAGLTMSAVCGSCGTIIDTSDERRQILERVAEKLQGIEPVIPIGKRGTFRDTEYEVIGFVVRRDAYASWSEYLLFNPWRGFDWLVTYNGHWTFVERLLETPGNSDSSPYGFRLFADYKAMVVSVLGEFYWQTSTAEVTDVQDFVNPPNVVSRETYPGLGEITWSRGKYVDAKDVGAAFGIEALPSPVGVYLNQPNPFQARWADIRRMFYLAVLLLCGLQLYSCNSDSLKKVHESQYVFRRADAARVFTSEPFEIKGAGMVAVNGNAGVSNSWIELDFGLLNEVTSARYDKDLEIEYYSGSDSDGPWTEGSRIGTATLSGVPPGKYRLVIEPEADLSITEMPFTMRVMHGGVFWSNFWMVLMVLLAYPLYLFFRSASFERRRWAESELSATPSSSTDDDE